MTKSISTHIRLRGLQPSDGRVEEGGVAIDGKQVSVVCGRNLIKKTWTFDTCHDERSKQEDVFDQVKPTVDSVISGKNATIIAYGVTGSGKTYTMEGSPSDPGVIRRSVQHLMDRLEHKVGAVAEGSIKMSFLEILKDQVYDLLGQRVERLAIRTDAQGNNVIDGLSKRSIGSMAEFERVYATAAALRRTASTKLNTQSSRSHAVLTVYTSTRATTGGPIKEGQLWLADLAGSEKNSQTGNTADRLQESKFINSSLTTLSRVIDAIRTRSKTVPYRDCKLTRILQPALSGNTKAVLICCLAPGAKYTSDIVNTLDFADRTKQVEDVSVFVDPENRRLSLPTARQRPATATGFRATLGPSTTLIPSKTAIRQGKDAKVGRSSLAPPKRMLGDITNRRYSSADEGNLQQEKVDTNGAAQQEIAIGHQDGVGATRNRGNESRSDVRPVDRQPSIADLCEVVQGAIDGLHGGVERSAGQNGKGTDVPVCESAGSESRVESERCTPGVSEAILTEEERDAKARALVKEARKHQTEGHLELARKLFMHAKPLLRDARTITKRIYALEAEILARELNQQIGTAAPEQRKRANQDADGGVDVDVDMEGSTMCEAEPLQALPGMVERDGDESMADVTINARMPGWRIATLRESRMEKGWTNNEGDKLGWNVH